MTKAPDRIWAARGLYDTSPLVRHPTPIEYIRADLARPVTVAEAANVLLDDFDALLKLSGVVVRMQSKGGCSATFSLREALRALSHEGGE